MNDVGEEVRGPSLQRLRRLWSTDLLKGRSREAHTCAKRSWPSVRSGVSPTTVRQALSALAQHGFVEVLLNRGAIDAALRKVYKTSAAA